MDSSPKPGRAVSRIPQVDDSDVDRVVRRSFPEREHDQVRKLLSELSENNCLSLWIRARLAVLKLSDGDVSEVQKQIRPALVDCRDVIAPAESPRFWKIGFKGYRILSQQEKQKLIDEDFEDYEQWLYAH
jgi:hypothetical protein